MLQGQIGEISLLNSGKLFFPYVSIRPTQKLGTPTHLKTTFSNKYGTGLSSQNVSS